LAESALPRSDAVRGMTGDWGLFFVLCQGRSCRLQPRDQGWDPPL
jgi:hypothetical protein